MVCQDVRQLVTNLVNAWNAHDVDRVANLHAPDYEGVDVGEAVPRRGTDGTRQAMRRYLRAFPDLQFVEEATVVDGDRVAWVWRIRGTHLGPIMHIPPSGHCVEMRCVALLTLADGKIKQATYVWDVAGFLRAIGLLPEL
jgi:steroid delta-isomerase-like uncharacterized protein